MSVRVRLSTPLPGFANELSDILKLFFTVDSFLIDDGDGEPLVHTFSESDGVWTCAFYFRGESETLCAPVAHDPDPRRAALLYKRMQKRLCKRTLYALCKRLTGVCPPWGSLTGIRPTRPMWELLAGGMTMEQAQRALCETFDLSPEKAALLERVVAEQCALPQPAPDEADVYLSVPFCRTRCAYCSFPGEALGRGKQVEPYLSALFAEIEDARRMMEAAGLRVRALYIGGGTPTALDEDALSRLLDRIARCFPNPPLEYTVEAGRPDTITRGKLLALRAHGVTRVSVNPQTMNDRTLAAIGRDHTALETVEAYRLAREVGFDDINMDVIAGLPGENEADFQHTMDEIYALAPDSLTVHALAIKHSSRLNLQKHPLPPAALAARMTALGEQTAAALGLRPYYLYRQKYMAGQQQNVGYARPGAACLYNVDIMEEIASIVALGAGAISKRVFPDRERRIERAPNVSNVAEYTARVAEMSARKRSLFLGEDDRGFHPL